MSATYEGDAEELNIPCEDGSRFHSLSGPDYRGKRHCEECGLGVWVVLKAEPIVTVIEPPQTLPSEEYGWDTHVDDDFSDALTVEAIGHKCHNDAEHVMIQHTKEMYRCLWCGVTVSVKAKMSTEVFPTTLSARKYSGP